MEIEEVRKNTHQTHIESLVFSGEAGLQEINSYIRDNLDQETSTTNKTTKIDGAPALLIGHNVPGYPKEFVGIKSVLSSSKNAYSTPQEIKANKPNIAKEMIYGLDLAKYIPDGEIWQGDVLFTKGEAVEQTIDGKDYITFQPNTVVYAFPETNPDYNKLANADFGICFHTIYTGQDGEFKQSFKVDLTRINVPDKYFLLSPTIKINKDKIDSNKFRSAYEKLVVAERKLLNDEAYEEICKNDLFQTYWATFENHITSDQALTHIDKNTFIDDLKQWVDSIASAAIAKLKKASSIESHKAELQELQNFIDNHKNTLSNMVDCFNLVVDIKDQMLSWQDNPGYDMYFRSRTKGYKPSAGEGIALSDGEGNIVKLVNRAEFSKANRDPDIIKGFEHESLEEKIVKKGSKYQVQSEKGRNMGTYDTKAEAKKRLQQVHYFKYKNEDLDESINADIVINITAIVKELNEAIVSGNQDDYDIDIISEYYEFIDDVDSMLKKNGIIAKANPSTNKSSLSEYFNFYLTDEDGNKKTCLISLRISDHDSRQAHYIQQKKANKLDKNNELIAVIVNENTFKTYDDAFKAIKNIIFDKTGIKLKECFIHSKKLVLEECIYNFADENLTEDDDYEDDLPISKYPAILIPIIEEFNETYTKELIRKMGKAYDRSYINVFDNKGEYYVEVDASWYHTTGKKDRFGDDEVDIPDYDTSIALTGDYMKSLETYLNGKVDFPISVTHTHIYSDGSTSIHVNFPDEETTEHGKQSLKELEAKLDEIIKKYDNDPVFGAKGSYGEDKPVWEVSRMFGENFLTVEYANYPSMSEEKEKKITSDFAKVVQKELADSGFDARVSTKVPKGFHARNYSLQKFYVYFSNNKASGALKALASLDLEEKVVYSSFGDIDD